MELGLEMLLFSLQRRSMVPLTVSPELCHTPPPPSHVNREKPVEIHIQLSFTWRITSLSEGKKMLLAFTAQ